MHRSQTKYLHRNWFERNLQTAQSLADDQLSLTGRRVSTSARFGMHFNLNGHN